VSGYSVIEKRIQRKRKPRENACGSCGAPAQKYFCAECLIDLEVLERGDDAEIAERILHSTDRLRRQRG
jgi:hypothetical protein